MIELRTYVFLDSLQPQLASYVAATSRGFFPVPHEASLWVEIAPGMEINRVTDIAQKSTSVKPGVQVVERQFGVLEVHAPEQDEVMEAGAQILRHLQLSEKMRKIPRVLTSEIITNVDPYQAMLINRMRRGSLLIPGQALYILEVEPSVYATLAANQAEKASPVSLIDIQAIGAFGRLYLAGSESVVSEGAKAAEDALRSVDGR
jgi:hypothetical protein